MSVSSKSSTNNKIEPLPGPWRVTFDTNPDDCNMSCVMCEEHSEFSPLKRERIMSGRQHRRMDISVIKSTVAQMAEAGLMEIIPSTMGEPLLYHNFLDIIETCKEHNVKLNLTTNGTWPKLGVEQWANLICPVASDVKVSWNGATAYVQESIMKGSSYHQRVEDLRKFIQVRNSIAKSGQNRCRVTIQATFMEANILELPDLIRLAINIGADRVKGHHLWAHFSEIKNQDLRRSDESIKLWNKVSQECIEVAKNSQREDGSTILLENFDPIPEEDHYGMPEDWVCPFLGKEAWINFQGRFDPCCAPDAERKSLGYFGLVTSEGGLSGIWKGKKYQELMKEYMKNEVCRKCNMRRPIKDR
jgi:MoaA/NifB/PqqE/SkfB family radical SAM enzyme